MKSTIFTFLLLIAPFSLSVGADVMTCEVHGVKDRPDLENGVFEADLVSANAVLHMPLGGPTLVLITNDLVSQFEAPRASCKYIFEKLHRADGSVYEMAFKFSTCAGPNGALVFAQHKFNLESGKGVYVEELVQLGPKGLGLPLSNCARHDGSLKLTDLAE